MALPTQGEGLPSQEEVAAAVEAAKEAVADAVDEAKTALPDAKEAKDAVVGALADVKQEVAAAVAPQAGGAAERQNGGASTSTAPKTPALAPTLTRALTTREAKAALEAQAEAAAAKSIQASTIFKALFAGWVALMAIAIKWLDLLNWELVVGGIGGVAWGTLLAVSYRWNRKRKADQRHLLALVPGAKGMQELLHHIPTWISFRETEKMEWLNRVLEKVWPYYDEAVCKAVKEQVEPLMDMYKPPGLIKKIYFQKLTFGDDPFRVEGIRVDKTNPDEVCLEVDYRWAGAANIFLAIELPAGGSATRMVPKVSNLAVSGTLRISLKPLLPEIPGFGAAMVSLRQPPIVRFNLDFGKSMGGGYTAGAIKAWLDPFLRQTVSGMMLWPKRMVVPILPEEVTGPLDDLYLRHRGTLQVDCIEARALPRMDTVGSTDAFLKVYTLIDPNKADSIEKTKIIKRSLNPVWNERLWVLVQEPTTQALYIECFDRDYLNAKELMRLNVFKGATSVVNAEDLVGRVQVPINDLALTPGETVDKWLPLGRGAFSDEEGCGGGYGEVHVKLTYWPFELMRGHTEAKVGAVIVTLLRCNDLPPADLPLGTSDPFVEFTLNKETHASPVVDATLDPKWVGQTFDWFKVPSGSTLKVKVMDYDAFSRNELLGDVDIDLFSEVQSAPGGDITKQWHLENLATDWMQWPGGAAHKKKEPKPATVTLRVQWIPFQE